MLSLPEEPGNPAHRKRQLGGVLRGDREFTGQMEGQPEQQWEQTGRGRVFVRG